MTYRLCLALVLYMIVDNLKSDFHLYIVTVCVKCSVYFCAEQFSKEVFDNTLMIPPLLMKLSHAHFLIPFRL